jgi:GNAT superfamily N-acetyltransferase
VLRWIVVLPAHRGCGVGSALLRFLEAQIRKNSGEVFHAAYSVSVPESPWIGRMFEGTGWPAGRRAISLTCSGTLLTERWVCSTRIPEGLRVFPWIGSGSESELQGQAWVPQHLAPWRVSEPLEPVTSLGLSCQGATVGWLLTSQTAPDTIRYQSLFVRPDLRQMGGARILLAESIRRQACAFGADSRGEFTVAVENKAMILLMDSHLRPHKVAETELMVLFKSLGKSGLSVAHHVKAA